MTIMQKALEIDVVQHRACHPNQGACMVIETSRASALQLTSRHVCDDPRASGAKREVVSMVAEARGQGFLGEITAHFPPGTYGAHFVDPLGRLVPRPSLRPAR